MKEEEIVNILRQHTHDDVIGIIMSYIKDECFGCCEEMIDNDLFYIEEECIKLCFDCIIMNNYRTCLSCNKISECRTSERFTCRECRINSYSLWIDEWEDLLIDFNEIIDELID